MNWDKLGFSGLTSIGVGNIGAALVNGLFWMYLASILSVENYGEIGYFFTIATIANVVAFLGAGNTLVVFVAKGIKIQPPLYTLTIISSTITAIVVFFIFNNLGVSLYVIGSVLFGLVLNDLLGKKYFKNWSKFIIIQRLLLVGLALGLYYLIGIQGVILGFAISFFPFIYYVIKEIKNSKIDFSLLKQKKNFISNNYASQLVSIFSQSVDRLIIYPLFGFALLGNYHLGIQFLLLLNLIPSIIFQYTLTHDASGNPKTMIKKMTLLIAIATSIITIFFAPILLPVVFPKYDDSIEIIQILSIAVVPRAIIYIISSKFLGNEKSSIVMRASGIFLGSNILGIFILGSIMGITGVAVSVVIATIAETIFLLYSRKSIKIR